MRLKKPLKDERGTVVVTLALLAPVIFGFAALAIDVASWQVAQKSMQGAADAAAYSAAATFQKGDGTSFVTQAKAISAASGFIDGQNNVTVTVNQPPTSGNYTGTATAIEVIVRQPQPRFLAGLFLSSDPAVNARAVATPAPTGGSACILALDPSISNAIVVSGSASINSGCDVVANSTSSSAVVMSGGGTITTPCLVTSGNVSGVSNLTSTKCSAAKTGAPPTADPYASVPQPSIPSGGCLNVPGTSTVTLSPGYYCGGISIPSGTTGSLSPGLYYLAGDFAISGGGAISGTGVTIYLTTGNKVAVSSSSTANLTAQTSGTYSGIAFFGSRSGTISTNNSFSGSSASSITGAIYFPTQRVTFSGSSTAPSSCTQLIAGKITVSGSANFNNTCSGSGAKTISVADGTSSGKVAVVE